MLQEDKTLRWLLESQLKTTICYEHKTIDVAFDIDISHLLLWKRMANGIRLVVVVDQILAMPRSTRTNEIVQVFISLNEFDFEIFVTGVQIKHEIIQAQPIMIDARFGVRFERYVNGRVIEKYRSKQMRRRLATEAFDIV